MLEKIKSSYFIKNCFSNLEERNRLKLVKYNKRLQNNLDINNISYMTFKKYIIYGKNEKGKEYDYNGNKSYEGEYFNGGKRHEKGREYNEY